MFSGAPMMRKLMLSGATPTDEQVYNVQENCLSHVAMSVPLVDRDGLEIALYRMLPSNPLWNQSFPSSYFGTKAKRSGMVYYTTRVPLAGMSRQMYTCHVGEDDVLSFTISLRSSARKEFRGSARANRSTRRGRHD